ncbi:unnamed protein product [Arctia plantaginis]|uniref:Metallo-beta-lactamase domain-containing protein n=1 Tax=Arctia plantaginis TaxID=874455 RepID=A0A8S1A925_ARCPL|nr:unnamed protein product [Arctia plantaginis]
MKSAFSGYIPEIPFILVDNFENKQKCAYFLSHFHGDHIFGLNSKDFPAQLKKNKGFIYASAVTVAIVKNEVPELSSHLKILDLGRNTVTITEDNEEIYLNVTTLPAGHSLGSVMFLFNYKETILYTGDFRITQNTVASYTHLHKNGVPIHLDSLYVDTTFQDVRSFPKRSEVVRNVAEQVRDWLNMSIKHRVVLITSACYGYECVCNEVYSTTGIKTYINAVKWKVFSQFPKEMYGITSDAASRIHLGTKREHIYSELPEVLTIYFSAMKWGQNIEDENYIKTIKKNKIEVCFATHCGRDELLYFINYFKPKRIVGFPEPYNKVAPSEFECPLDFQISERLKRRRSNSESENLAVGRKISKSDVTTLFDW